MQLKHNNCLLFPLYAEETLHFLTATLFLFFHLVQHGPFLRILHPSFRWLAGSVMAVICAVVLLVPLMLRTVIHNQFTISTIILTFSVLGLLFSEHSQVRST